MARAHGIGASASLPTLSFLPQTFHSNEASPPPELASIRGLPSFMDARSFAPRSILERQASLPLSAGQIQLDTIGQGFEQSAGDGELLLFTWGAGALLRHAKYASLLNEGFATRLAGGSLRARLAGASLASLALAACDSEKSSSNKIDTSRFKGPQGDPGPMGPEGPEGPMGPQGPAGERGPVGPQGPKGNDGLSGAQGAQGAQGPAGPGINLNQCFPKSTGYISNQNNISAVALLDCGVGNMVLSGGCRFNWTPPNSGMEGGISTSSGPCVPAAQALFGGPGESCLGLNQLESSLRVWYCEETYLAVNVPVPELHVMAYGLCCPQP